MTPVPPSYISNPRQVIFDALEHMRLEKRRSVLLPSPPVEPAKKFWRAAEAKELLSRTELAYLVKKKNYTAESQVSFEDVCEMIGWDNAIENELELVLGKTRTLF
ncbi:MAG: hypothetical protein ACRCYY_16365 [Trueperaceae bacterium]